MTQEKLKITQFALEKFTSSGLKNVTMDEIARELQMSKKTIYKHFPNKEALIREAIFFLTGTVKKTIESVVAGNDSAVHKLHGISNVLRNVVLKISDRWLIDLKMRYNDVWQEVDKFRVKSIAENFSKIIEQGKSEGLIDDKPTKIIYYIIIASVQEIVNPKFLVENSYSAKDAAQITLDIIFKGILTKKGRKIYKQLETENK
ncbi:MAG: TetR/AcrR family transcriptional regulator [Bacteroidetes bacterium]|nr:TetR/AcrR family transcriptional regulator [Bacteroidota bacterium]